MKVKRYYAEEIDFELWADVQLVSATDYDALLVLARRLRIELVSYAKDAPVMCDDIELLDDSEWLEE